MGLDKKFLEPRDDGLVICTEHGDESVLSLWYYGRPREVFRDGSRFYDPFVHDDRIYAISGSEGFTGPGQYLKDCLDGKIVYDEWFTAIDSAVSFKGQVRIARESYDVSSQSECVTLSPQFKSRRIIPYAYRISKLASDGEATYNLEQHHDGQTVFRMGKPRRIAMTGSNLRHPLTTISVLGETILTGSTGFIKRSPIILDDFVPRQEKYFFYDKELMETNAKILGYLHEWRLKREQGNEWDIKKVLSAEEHRRILNIGRSRGYDTSYLSSDPYNLGNPLADINGIQDHFKEYHTVGEILPFHGQVLYSVYNKLYALGRKKPIRTFRHPITGLVAVPQEPLKDLKGNASVRRGNKKQHAAFRAVA